jgi:hypothetical protein
LLNYLDYKLKKDDIYLFDYKLLNKCCSKALDKLLQESKENNNIECDELLNQKKVLVKRIKIYTGKQ